MEKVRKQKVMVLIVLVVSIISLSVAFASLSNTLTITGTSTMDKAGWNIHFENLSQATIKGQAQVNTTPSLATNNTEISNINVTLKEPKDKVIYKVDIKNDGDINAKIGNIITPNIPNNLKDIVDFSVRYTDGKSVSENDVILAGGKETVTIMIRYINITDSSLLPSSAQNMNFSYAINYVQTSDTTKVHAGNIPNVDYNDMLVGDKFCLDGNNECFYTINDNGDTVTALAAWNVNVNTNRQIAGSVSGLAFSDRQYWGYGTNKFIFDDNSNLYEPLNNYENYIRQTLGRTSVQATLLSYEQAISLGCVNGSCKSAPTWLYNWGARFWTGSTCGGITVWNIWDTNASFGCIQYNYTSLGLRPVITISKSEI